ncbi:Ger(x)C family spore germination protein [Paenibacillus sp. N3.4]|uniref:Ger(x)C family spore germination protein n=1 Tax=Paenibacillus sp. N3.4 TaxID=2603222 RepID=UPI0011C89704|nr:Ger(x)C family spore germination protein [Paenibacillus sp. N3.4]TXK81466.1 Ger(x)C family spore germination protein [Paenibacillus sp. N3.4]
MNKRLVYALWITAMIVVVPGCADRLDMEDATLALALGVDLNEENKLMMYSTSPAFSKRAKKKTLETIERAQTLRESRAKQDAFSAGVFQGRNYQVLIVGKRLLQHEDWFPLLDVLFRDTKNSVSDRVVVYDGPVSEIIYLNPKDQPMMPILLRGMVDTKSAQSETVKTTVQELHRQMYETGVTPAISEVKLQKKQAIKLNGTALLNHKGKYIVSLNATESILLRILQNKAKKSVNLTISIPGEEKIGPFDTDKLSFTANNIKAKLATSYRQNKFHFEIKINMHVGLTEHLFPYDVRYQGKELEVKIAEQLEKQLEGLIKKIQAHEIDPIGLGLYARAHENSQYKKVKDHWGESLAKADIHVSVKATIDSMGPVK